MSHGYDLDFVAKLPADLVGHVAVVTGGSRGIGRAVSLKLASLGASVIVNYAGNAAAATEVVDAITKSGRGKATAVQGDVSKAEDAQRLIDETIRIYGRLDILVNNAGVFSVTPILDHDIEEFHRVVRINVNGTFLPTRAAVKVIQDGGVIINISTVATKAIFPGTSVYAATKGFVEAFTRALAVELAPRKIRVNTVSPGYTVTDMLMSNGEGIVETAAQFSIFKRPGTAEDIAESVAFLAHPRSGAWITGQNIGANGGIAFAL